jgi:hypothetical protein
MIASQTSPDRILHVVGLWIPMAITIYTQLNFVKQITYLTISDLSGCTHRLRTWPGVFKSFAPAPLSACAKSVGTSWGTSGIGTGRWAILNVEINTPKSINIAYSTAEMRFSNEF